VSPAYNQPSYEDCVKSNALGLRFMCCLERDTQYRHCQILVSIRNIITCKQIEKFINLSPRIHVVSLSPRHVACTISDPALIVCFVLADVCFVLDVPLPGLFVFGSRDEQRPPVILINLPVRSRDTIVVRCLEEQMIVLDRAAEGGQRLEVMKGKDSATRNVNVMSVQVIILDYSLEILFFLPLLNPWPHQLSHNLGAVEITAVLAISVAFTEVAIISEIVGTRDTLWSRDHRRRRQPAAAKYRWVSFRRSGGGGRGNTSYGY